MGVTQVSVKLFNDIHELNAVPSPLGPLPRTKAGWKLLFLPSAWGPWASSARRGHRGPEGARHRPRENPSAWLSCPPRALLPSCPGLAAGSPQGSPRGRSQGKCQGGSQGRCQGWSQGRWQTGGRTGVRTGPGTGVKQVPGQVPGWVPGQRLPRSPPLSPGLVWSRRSVLSGSRGPGIPGGPRSSLNPAPWSWPVEVSGSGAKGAWHPGHIHRIVGRGRKRVPSGVWAPAQLRAPL